MGLTLSVVVSHITDSVSGFPYGPLTRFVQLRVAHAPGMLRNVFPCHRLQRKPLISNPGMHHGTCVTHVPWCMSGSLTCDGGENVPGIQAHAQTQFYVSGKRPITLGWWPPGAEVYWTQGVVGILLGYHPMYPAKPVVVYPDHAVGGVGWLGGGGSMGLHSVTSLILLKGCSMYS